MFKSEREKDKKKISTRRKLELKNKISKEEKKMRYERNVCFSITNRKQLLRTLS